MNYKPKGRAELVILIIKGIGWLVITPIKWIIKKYRDR